MVNRSRKPEKASTRPPAKARSSFPQRDPRPPRRGKSGSPLATRSAKSKGGGTELAPKGGAPTQTSLSGKPTAASDLSKIPSTETRPKKAGRKSKGKVETPANPMERRTLTPAEQGQVALRAARLSVEARRREAKLKRETKAERDEIAELWAQAEALEDQAEQGYELVPEGDLFADRAESEAGKTTPSMPIGAAANALAKVAAAAGEQPVGQEPNAPMGAADDISRAANADAVRAHA